MNIYQNLSQFNERMGGANMSEYKYMSEINKVIERENLLTSDQADCNQFNHELVQAKCQP